VSGIGIVKWCENDTTSY